MTAAAGNRETQPCQDNIVNMPKIKQNPLAAQCLKIPCSLLSDDINVRTAVKPIVNPAVQAFSKAYCPAQNIAPSADQRRKAFPQVR